MTENDKKSLQQSLRDAWMGALGLWTTAEEELVRAGQRILDSLGPSPTASADDATLKGEGASDAGAAGFPAELLRRLRKNQKELEHRVDEAVKTAVARVRDPLVAEVGALREQLERLAAKVEARKRRGEKPPGDDAGGGDAG